MSPETTSCLQHPMGCTCQRLREAAAVESMVVASRAPDPVRCHRTGLAGFVHRVLDRVMP